MNEPVKSIAQHGDPAQVSLPFDRDKLTPRNHHLRSRTLRTRDARVIGEKLREYWLRKARTA